MSVSAPDPPTTPDLPFVEIFLKKQTLNFSEHLNFLFPLMKMKS